MIDSTRLNHIPNWIILFISNPSFLWQRKFSLRQCYFFVLFYIWRNLRLESRCAFLPHNKSCSSIIGVTDNSNSNSFVNNFWNRLWCYEARFTYNEWRTLWKFTGGVVSWIFERISDSWLLYFIFRSLLTVDLLYFVDQHWNGNGM